MTTLPLIDLGQIRLILFFAAISLTAVVWVFKWNKFLSLPAQMLWAYTLVSALFILEFPLAHFAPYTSAFQAQAGQIVAEVVFIPLLAMMLHRWIGYAIPWAAGAACLAVWFNVPGFLNAPSFNTAFAAACVPLIPWWVRLPVLVTICAHHGSTAMLIVGVQLLAYCRAPKFFAGWAVLAAGLAWIAHTHSGALFDGGERLEHWHRYMEFWAREPRWVILGVGPGSFTYIAAMLDKFQAPLFLQMHSDWLQILWELGAAGLVLAVFTFGDAVKRAWKDPDALASVLGIGAFAITYHPLRYLPTALLTAWILVRVVVNYKVDSRPTRPSNWSESLR